MKYLEDIKNELGDDIFMAEHSCCKHGLIHKSYGYFRCALWNQFAQAQQPVMNHIVAHAVLLFSAVISH